MQIEQTAGVLMDRHDLDDQDCPANGAIGRVAHAQGTDVGCETLGDRSG